MITVTSCMSDSRKPPYIPDEATYPLTGFVNWRLTVRPHSWRPPTDIYETEERYFVRVEIAGMKNSEFAVTVDNNTLSIHGVRSDTPEKRAYHQMEIHYGEFNLEVEFPSRVDVDKVEADYDDGFLRVSLPKIETKQINLGDH